MKALFISNDPLIFDEQSAVRARMRAYAAAIGTLHIVSHAPRSIELQDGALFLHGRKAGKAFGSGMLTSTARQVVREHAIEIVSAQDPFEHGRIAYNATKGTTAKLHLQVHTDFLSPWFVRSGIFRSANVPMPLKNRARRVLADQLLPKAHGIRTVSERVKASLIARYGERIATPTVIPIAASTMLPNAVPLPPHPFPFALITVGRLEPEKRIEDILDALARIKDAYPAVGLIVVGDGRERRKLESRAAELGLSERVLFLGARPDAWGLMRSCQAYVQASAYEGYGVTLIEAALARLPIVTTDVGIVGEVLTGYEDALVTPPGDPTNLSYHIIALLEDVGARENMVRHAEAKVTAHLAQFANLPELIARDLAATISGSRVV